MRKLWKPILSMATARVSSRFVALELYVLSTAEGERRLKLLFFREKEGIEKSRSYVPGRNVVFPTPAFMHESIG